MRAGSWGKAKKKGELFDMRKKEKRREEEVKKEKEKKKNQTKKVSKRGEGGKWRAKKAPLKTKDKKKA